VPESATVPLQAPLAWHAVALELDQVSVVDSPTVSAVGVAPILTMTGLLAEADVAGGTGGASPPPPPPPPLQETSSKHATTAAD
jgi:hypothetical protein